MTDGILLLTIVGVLLGVIVRFGMWWMDQE